MRFSCLLLRNNLMSNLCKLYFWSNPIYLCEYINLIIKHLIKNNTFYNNQFVTPPRLQIYRSRWVYCRRSCNGFRGLTPKNIPNFETFFGEWPLPVKWLHPFPMKYPGYGHGLLYIWLPLNLHPIALCQWHVDISFY